jgi:hypothetical protein
MFSLVDGVKSAEPVATATTGYSGRYLLAPLVEDTPYIIERDLPAGYQDPSVGAVTIQLNVSIGTLVNYANDFPLLLASPAVNPNPSGAIGGVIYVDWNNNGEYEEETGISGVVIRLTGTNDLGATISRIQITKPNGAYRFNGLRPGTFNVRQFQPSGAFDSAGPGTTIKGIQVVDGTASLRNDFGEIVMWTQTRTTTTSVTTTSRTTSSTTFVTATVGGRVAFDANGNGAWDALEPGIRSVTLRVTGTNLAGAPVSTQAVTDCTGYYHVRMQAGDYTIEKVNPVGWRDSSVAALKSSLGIRVRGVTMWHNWLVETDSSVMSVAGTNGCAISGRVYVDTKPNDNVFSITQENAVSGVTIRLTGRDVFGATVNITTTSASCSTGSCGGTGGCTNTKCVDTSCTRQPVPQVNVNGVYYFTGLRVGCGREKGGVDEVVDCFFLDRFFSPGSTTRPRPSPLPT